MRTLYRSRAVASSHVGDRMDMPVRIVRIRFWVALVIGAMGAMAIGAWLFLGTVSTTASGPAILTRGLFAVPIQSPEMVTIQEVGGTRWRPSYSRRDLGNRCDGRWPNTDHQGTNRRHGRFSGRNRNRWSL